VEENTYEIDADGRDVGFGVGVISESQKQARLSNTGVSDEEELEEIVVSVPGALVRDRRYVWGADDSAMYSGGRAVQANGSWGP